AFGGSVISTVEANGTGLASMTPGSFDYAPKWSPGGGVLVYESMVGGNHQIYTVNAYDRQRTAVAATPAKETQPSWSPDGKSIVYGSDGDIVVKTLATGAQVRLTSGPAEDDDAVFAPDGRTIVFARGNAGFIDIFAMDPDGANVRQLTNVAGDDVHPDFSPDGSRIVFASKRSGLSALYVMNVDGSAQTRLS